jgi:hypothetical protein
MSQQSTNAEGVSVEAPLVEAVPVAGPAPVVIVLAGDVTVMRRGVFVVVKTPAGNSVLIDANTVRLAAIAHGIPLQR